MSIILIAGALAVLGVVLLIYGLRAPSPADQVQARLAEYSARAQPVTLEEIELSQPFSQRVIVPLVQSVARFVTRFTPQRTLENTRRNLELAGNPYNWSPAYFWGLRGLTGILMGVLTFLLMTASRRAISQRFLFTGLMALLGFQIPVIWLGSRIRRRKAEILKALPDALDLLTICVEAGLGFDAAMSKVTEKWDNELAKEFGRVIQEIRLGKLRREALRDMADRVDVPDVTSFAAALIQADQLGVSIARVLRIQSEQMRIRRRQRAEEKAHQAPVKMVFPIAFFIFPSIYIVLLGPAFLKLMRSGALQAI